MINKTQPKGYYLKDHPEREDCGYFCCDSGTLDSKEQPHLFAFRKLHPSADTYLKMFIGYVQRFDWRGPCHLLKYQDDEFGVYLYNPGNVREIARVQLIDEKGAEVLDVLMMHFNDRENNVAIQNPNPKISRKKSRGKNACDGKYPQLSFLEEGQGRRGE